MDARGDDGKGLTEETAAAGGVSSAWAWGAAFGSWEGGGGGREVALRRSMELERSDARSGSRGERCG